jgi:methylmalonyl-CoA mutase
MVDMKDLLHATFNDVNRESWLRQLEKDLKGTTIQDALEFNDPIEEIEFKSHFHWSEAQQETAEPFSSVRSYKDNNDWIIYQEAATNNTNKSALENLSMGCSGIGFGKSSDLAQQLQDIQLEYIYSDFKASNLKDVQAILAILPEKKDTTLVCDPLTHGDTDEIIPIYNATKSETGLIAFEIDNAVFAAAGANNAQQIAIACSQVKFYFELLTEAGVNPNQLADKLQLKIGIGSNYLFEIAKFRALRLALDTILEAYNVEAGKGIRIKAQSLFLNKSLEDPYTNLLRLTTEGMSAAIGGADILHLQPYDAWSNQGASSFAYRMSTNISSILKEESFFNHVSDAAGGTYAIEKATELIAEKAWGLFQTIESNGGFLSSSEFIASRIKRIAEKRIALLQSKKSNLIGITIYPNPETTSLKWEVPAVTPIQPLILEQHKEGGRS